MNFLMVNVVDIRRRSPKQVAVVGTTGRKLDIIGGVVNINFPD